jgi:hypothetical protein
LVTGRWEGTVILASILGHKITKSVSGNFDMPINNLDVIMTVRYYLNGNGELKVSLNSMNIVRNTI